MRYNHGNQHMLDFWRVKHRKFNWDDLYSLQALINMIAEDENDPYFYNLEWLHFVLSQLDVNAEDNCFVATVYGGRIVGYSRIETVENPSYIRVLAGTHPNMQGIGIGRALIAVNDFNLMAKHSGNQPLTVVRQTPPDHAPSIQLLTHAGYKQVDTAEDGKFLWEKQLCGK